MLQHYFETRRINLSRQIDWQDPAQTQSAALFAAISALDQHDREIIITDFENVEQLCDRAGQIALHSVAAGEDRVLSLLQSAETDMAKSFTLLLANEALFERALAAAYADRLISGRSWTAFTIDAPTKGRKPSSNMHAFEADVAMALARADGSTGKLKIDAFERGRVGGDGKVVGRIVHYAIYSEDLPISDVEFSGDELKRETRRPVNEAAVVFDPLGGTLDVIANGGKTVRHQIANSLARKVLGIQGKINPMTVRQFALERLRRPIAFDSDAADGIEMVKVTLLRLEHRGGHHERITIEFDPSSPIDIWMRSNELFGDADPLNWPDWFVTHAMLRIVFHPERGRARKMTVPIQLRVNGSNLRDQTPKHQIVSQKYLARWGLLPTATA